MSDILYSVIIPCYNSVEYTIQCIQSVMKNTEDFELICVDDGSSDETPGYLLGVKQTAERNDVPMKIVTHEESKGFSSACNAGFKVSEGLYPVFLNSDTIVTPFWAARMVACLTQIQEQLPIGKFGITGPVSNYVGGQQMIQDLPKPFHLEQLDEFGDKWYQANPQRWMYTGFLSGFCMLFKRECFEAMNGFDELFDPGGFEDNDICKRAYNSGWKSIISGDVFVYHFGSRSMRLPEKQFMQGGMHNRGKYYKKFWAESEDDIPPVVVGYRVKNGGRWIKESVLKSLDVSDHVCILDDGSDDDTEKIIQLISDAHPGDVTYVRYEREFQELRDRNELWEMMRIASKDISDISGWGVIIDADEIFEDKVTRDYIQALACPVHPDIHGYIFKVDTFWRGRQKIRIDGTFGNLKGVRMVRFTEDQKLWTPHPQGLHCGNTPSTPPDYLAMTNVHLKHYGYENYEDAERKFEFYSRVDTVKDPMNVGGDGSYRHLVDESQIGLVDWRENNTLGLAIMGRNEAQFLPQFFERNHFYALFDQIVYVDCASDDDSKGLAQVYGAEIYDLPDKLVYQDGPYKGRLKHFGKARNFVKSKMNTQWILMLDADEYIDLQDIPALLRLPEHDIMTYRFQVYNHQPNGSVSHSENMRLYQNIEELYYTQHVHESLETAITRLGKTATSAIAPLVIHHLGYLRDPDYVQVKLEHYEELNNNDLKRDPADPRPYFNLALHYLNEGKNEEAIEYLSRACELQPSFIQSYRELGSVFLRKALPLFDHAFQTCAQDHPMYGQLKEVSDFLHRVAVEPLRVGKPQRDKEAE